MSDLLHITSRVAANDHCTCAEVAGENPECALHGVAITIRKLRAVETNSREEIDTIQLAADLLESLWDDVCSGRDTP